jgi:protocatechuate 3,4-dioxygenase beta subunit
MHAGKFAPSCDGRSRGEGIRGRRRREDEVNRMGHVDTKSALDARTLTRRGALRTLGVGSAAIFLGCNNAISTGTGGSDSKAATTGTTASGQTGASTSAATGPLTCDATPEETGGPYPDKMNLSAQAAYVRQDITEGKTGLPLTVALSIVNSNSVCSALANARVDVWQCDKDGVYSEYSQPGSDQTGSTFLRGTQISDSAGQLKFKTIYPGWYQGRVTHIHLEVYVNDKLEKTTQMAFPDAINAQVYASPLYLAHGQSPMSNADDMVFSDGHELELATLTGDTTNGFTAALQISIAV